ncbi:MAG: hypothetical protein IPH98_12650 [Saprospiraceae bacterium]|nr:hypothetical protein [Candidatus Defluviibacterium haderslevense]
MQEGLIKVLKEKFVGDNLIDIIIRSGYFSQHFISWDYKSTVNTVGDMMYGTKQFSSNFDIDKFISYCKGEFKFDIAPDFVSYRVKTKAEIDEILNDQRRKGLLEEGKMSFRGQTEEHYLDREIANPFRQDKLGREISILPGAYRKKDFNVSFVDQPRIIKLLVNQLDPSESSDLYSHDIFRAEQHYATKTEGLDISFDIETALFFSNYKYTLNDEKKALLKLVEKGQHKGVIYCFRFVDPPVKKTEFLIESFSLFKKYVPERILRQKCGLPVFSDYDRNIAVCDIDCIIYLDSDFEYVGLLKPRYMFPNREEDKFYDKLLDLKEQFKNHRMIKNIVEYQI